MSTAQRAGKASPRSAALLNGIVSSCVVQKTKKRSARLRVAPPVFCCVPPVNYNTLDAPPRSADIFVGSNARIRA